MRKSLRDNRLYVTFGIHVTKVMMDYDLAEMYQIGTRILNQTVKRNEDRFPDDFMFQLTEIEWSNISSQFVTTSLKKSPKSEPLHKKIGFK